MARSQRQTPLLPQQLTLQHFTSECKRGIAVFTDGLNLDLKSINQGKLVSGDWHSNPRKVSVGDCFVVYHRTGKGKHYPTTVFVGTITRIQQVGSGLYEYHAENVKATHIQGVNWIQFGGGRRSIRYFNY